VPSGGSSVECKYHVEMLNMYQLEYICTIFVSTFFLQFYFKEDCFVYRVCMWLELCVISV